VFFSGSRVLLRTAWRYFTLKSIMLWTTLRLKQPAPTHALMHHALHCLCWWSLILRHLSLFVGQCTVHSACWRNACVCVSRTRDIRNLWINGYHECEQLLWLASTFSSVFLSREDLYNLSMIWGCVRTLTRVMLLMLRCPEIGVVSCLLHIWTLVYSRTMFRGYIQRSPLLPSPYHF
jgi:hypothetical protein